MTRLPNRMPPKKTVPQPKPVVKKPIDMVTRGESVDTLLHEFYSSFTYGSNSSIDYDKEAKKIENEINNKCDCNKIAYIDLLNKKIDQIKAGEIELENSNNTMITSNQVNTNSIFDNNNNNEKEIVRVIVKTITGKQLFFNVDVEDKLSTLFDNIWEEEGIQETENMNKNSFRLSYSGGDCPTYNSMQEGGKYSDVIIRRPNINNREKEITLDGNATFSLVIASNRGGSGANTTNTNSNITTTSKVKEVDNALSTPINPNLHHSARKTNLFGDEDEDNKDLNTNKDNLFSNPFNNNNKPSQQPSKAQKIQKKTSFHEELFDQVNTIANDFENNENRLEKVKPERSEIESRDDVPPNTPMKIGSPVRDNKDGRQIREVKEVKEFIVNDKVNEKYEENRTQEDTIETRDTDILEKEIIDLNNIIQELKIKQMKTNETALNLEIENLKNIISFKDKENSLITKENQSMSKQLKKYESNIKNMLEENKLYREQVNKQVSFFYS